MTKEEVYNNLLKYFKDPIRASTFLKYVLQDKLGNYYENHPDQTFHRIASELARIEQKYPNPLSTEDIFFYLKDFRKIIFQGSPMMGIGNNFLNTSLSNCTVISSPQDNISSIIDAAKDMSNLYKRRAGVGLSLDNLRPEGAPVNNSAKTSTGAWSFIELYSAIGKLIGQNGRRAAGLVSMSIKHPDALRFARAKIDPNKSTAVNISLQLTDDFMEAVECNKMFTQQWPIVSDNPQIVQQVNAQELFDEICQLAHDTGDPGLQFIDTIRKNLPADCYPRFRTVSTNPCQPAWATILTPNGISTIGQIQVGDIIWSGEQWTKVINKQSSGKQDIWEYHTRGGVFVGTKQHQIVSNGKKIQVKDAESIDISTGPVCTTKAENIQYIMDGLVLGDGGKHKASNNLVGLYIGKKDQDYFKNDIACKILKHRPGIKPGFYEVETNIQWVELPKTHLRNIPERYMNLHPEETCSFLRGLYSANGSICGQRITLKAASRDIIIGVQILLSSLGIKSYYTVNKPILVRFKNGEYLCKQSYDLNILENRKLFAELIGFIQQHKMEKLVKICQETKQGSNYKTTYEITEKEFISNEEVFNITVEAPEHTYWTGGLLVGNCGELPLSEYSACILLSQNLTSYVSKPFTKKAKFNFQELEEDTMIAQRLADDLIDLELEKLDNLINVSDTQDEKDMFTKFKINLRDSRRTGVGTQGLADVFIMMGHIYGDKESIELTRKIFKTRAQASYDASNRLADMRGPFPVFDWQLEKHNPFINQLPEDLVQRIVAYGRRNISTLTNAPTGSISLLAGTSAGIEPNFAFSYTRKKRKNHDDPPNQNDYVDQSGERWEVYTIEHPLVSQWKLIYGSESLEFSKLPEFFIESNNVDIDGRIAVQAAAQQYIDHAISNTYNVPRNTPVETVRDIYFKAWKAELKGVTVFVDGCKDSVLSHIDSVQKDATKRPEILDCDIHTVSIKKEKWTIIVGLHNNEPYEVFGGRSEEIELPASSIKGKIKKITYKAKPASYNLILENGIIIKDIGKVFDNELYQVHTRMVSLGLRHGARPNFIAEQLLKDKADSDLTSFSRVLARVLKKYINNGTFVSSEKICTECGHEGLIYQEGCITCTSCGFSKCG